MYKSLHYMCAWKESVFCNLQLIQISVFYIKHVKNFFLTEIFDVRQPAYLYHAVWPGRQNIWKLTQQNKADMPCICVEQGYWITFFFCFPPLSISARHKWVIFMLPYIHHKVNQLKMSQQSIQFCFFVSFLFFVSVLIWR